MNEDNEVRFLLNPEDKTLIYRPSNNDTSEEKKTTVAVRFSNNIYLTESFLKQFNVEYTPDDLEYTPLGPCFIIRPEDKEDKKNERMEHN